MLAGKKLLLLNTGKPAWVPTGSSLAADFINNRGYAGGKTQQLANLFSASRASVKYMPTAEGNYVQILANALPITDLGLLPENLRTNGIRNNSMQGGGAGVLPTNWSVAFTNGGTLAATIVGVGVESGIDFVDINIVGTSGTAASFIIRDEVTNNIAAATGQNWARSAFYKSVSGVAPEVFLYLDEISSVNGFVAGHQIVGVIPGTAALGTQRLTGNVTLSGGATTAFVAPSNVMFFTNSTAYNFTIRIGWPQAEIIPNVTAMASSPMRTTGTAVSRAADVISLIGPANTAMMNAAAAAFVTNGIPGNGLNDLLVSGNNSILFQNTTAVRMSNGVTPVTATIGGGGLSTGTVSSAFGFDAVSLTAVANGGTKATQLVAWAPPGTGVIGNRVAGDRSLDGFVTSFFLSNAKGLFG